MINVEEIITSISRSFCWPLHCYDLTIHPFTHQRAANYIPYTFWEWIYIKNIDVQRVLLSLGFLRTERIWDPLIWYPRSPLKSPRATKVRTALGHWVTEKHSLQMPISMLFPPHQLGVNTNSFPIQLPSEPQDVEKLQKKMPSQWAPSTSESSSRRKLTPPAHNASRCPILGLAPTIQPSLWPSQRHGR